jgi:hypothetical protein
LKEVEAEDRLVQQMFHLSRKVLFFHRDRLVAHETFQEVGSYWASQILISLTIFIAICDEMELSLTNTVQGCDASNRK